MFDIIKYDNNIYDQVTDVKAYVLVFYTLPP